MGFTRALNESRDREKGRKKERKREYKLLASRYIDICVKSLDNWPVFNI